LDHLYRELAPITPPAWAAIDAAATQALKRTLAGRQLVDFSGPHGWSYSAIGLGRTAALAQLVPGVDVQLRRSQPLVELTVPFTLARTEIETIARGGDADLDAVVEAARAAAHAEDRTVFDGCAGAGIVGMLSAAAAWSLPLADDYEKYPKSVAAALSRLRQHGVDGPYAIALGPRCYQGLTETTNKGGYPVMDLVRQQLDGRLIWAPAIDGAVVLSTRGGDFELVVGEDFSIGYARHDAETVMLYLQESIAFLVRSPEAAVPLRYEKSAREPSTTGTR
jgi:uncharacterized linocin/CFP29 family protein